MFANGKRSRLFAWNASNEEESLKHHLQVYPDISDKVVIPWTPGKQWYGILLLFFFLLYSNTGTGRALQISFNLAERHPNKDKVVSLWVPRQTAKRH
jgi:hypothetical protein